MFVRKCLPYIALTVTMLMTNASLYAALLEGHQVAARLEHQDTINSNLEADEAGPVAVGPGLEANDLGASLQDSVIVDIDFSDTQIVITAVNDQPPSFIERIGIGVFGAPPISMSLNPATNWAGFVPGAFQPSGQQVNIVLQDSTALAGQQIVIDVVPEPAAAGLAAAAAPALLAAHRRRPDNA
jgi:hypothetical protein